MFMSNLYMLSNNKLALKPLKVALIQSKVIYTSALFRQQNICLLQAYWLGSFAEAKTLGFGVIAQCDEGK